MKVNIKRDLLLYDAVSCWVSHHNKIIVSHGMFAKQLEIIFKIIFSDAGLKV